MVASIVAFLGALVGLVVSVAVVVFGWVVITISCISIILVEAWHTIAPFISKLFN